MTESVNTQICGTPILKRTEGENWINWNKLPVTILTVLVSRSILRLPLITQINLLLRFLLATPSAKQKKYFCFIILLLARHGVLWDNSCCLLPSVLGLKQHPYSLSCPSSSTPYEGVFLGSITCYSLTIFTLQMDSSSCGLTADYRRHSGTRGESGIGYNDIM